MPVRVIDTIKPQTNVFPVVEAVDVAVDATNRLPAALAAKADVTTAENLQGQINQIVISSTAEAVVAPEVAQARVGADNTEYDTLKERLDEEYGTLKRTLNEGLPNIENNNCKILFDINNISLSTDKQYVHYFNGEVYPSTVFRATDFIPIESNQTVYVTIWKMSDVGDNGLAFYDANKEFISGSGLRYPVSESGEYEVYETPVRVPASAKYIRVSVNDEQQNAFKIKSYDVPLYAKLNEVERINSPNRIYAIRGGLTDSGEYVANSYRASISDIDVSPNKRINIVLPETITIAKVLEKKNGTYYLTNNFNTNKKYNVAEIIASDDTQYISISFAHLDYDLERITDEELFGIEVKAAGRFDDVLNDLEGYNSINHIAKEFHLLPIKYEIGSFNISGTTFYQKLTASTRLRTASPINVSGFSSLLISLSADYQATIIQLDAEKMPLSGTNPWLDGGEVILSETCSYIDVTIRGTDNHDMQISEKSNLRLSAKSSFANIKKQTSEMTVDFLRVFTSFTGIGDSLMAGYTSDGTHTVNSAEARSAGNNWIEYLCSRLNRDCTNLAVGSSTAENWRYVNQSGTTDSDIEKADIPTSCYMLGLGVNDVRQTKTVGTASDIKSDYNNNINSFYGNYDYLINRLKIFNPYAKIFCFLIPSSEGNVAPYNSAIEHIASLYSNVYAINLENVEVYTDAFISGSFKAGHYNPMMYNYMSCIIEKALNNFIKNNMQKFAWVPYEYN